MPIATFLESYDFSGKTILPFCSHSGGRFGQSLTAIAKLAPLTTQQVPVYNVTFEPSCRNNWQNLRIQ